MVKEEFVRPELFSVPLAPNFNTLPPAGFEKAERQAVEYRRVEKVQCRWSGNRGNVFHRGSESREDTGHC